MGQFGDVWGYYPQDSDGLAVRSARLPSRVRVLCSRRRR